MSDPRKHHYIPVFYLRQWATNGFLCEMRKVNGKVVVRSKAPDGTGYQRDLYKIDGVQPDIAQHLERSFMHMVDSEAANAMRKIPDGHRATWSVKERDAWVRFLLSLLFRNPEAVALFKDQLKRIWDEGLAGIRENYHAKMHPGDPPTFEEFLKRTNPNAAAVAASNFLQRMMNSEVVANGILSLQWGRVNFPNSRHTLLTSDRPLDMPFGLQSKDAYIVLPIGPRTIFTATRDKLSLKGFSGKDQTKVVRNINEGVVARARQYVWAVDDQARQFVQKHINTLPDRQLISEHAKQLSEAQARGE